MNRLLSPPRSLPLLLVCIALFGAIALWNVADAVGRTQPKEIIEGVPPQNPNVWAGVSASVEGATTNAMYSVVELDRLMIGVALVNDGIEPLPLDRKASRLIVNGVALEIFDGTGPVWNQVESGKPFGASMGGIGGHLTRPGLYKIQWVGSGFASDVLEIRVVEN